MNTFKEFFVRKKWMLAIFAGVLAVLLFGGYIYLRHENSDFDSEASQELTDAILQEQNDEDYDALLDRYETADALIDESDLSDEDKEVKHNALQVYGDAIKGQSLSKKQAQAFAELIADIEEVAKESGESFDAEEASDTDAVADTDTDVDANASAAYDEAYLDTDGNMHYTKKLSAEEFYNYEIRFKGISKEDAQKTLEENIASGWTEIYVPVDENGNYIEE